MSGFLFIFGLLFFLFFLTGIFIISEIVFVSARKNRLQQQLEQGEKAAKRALALTDNMSWLLSSIQIGITLMSVLVGVMGGVFFAQPLQALFIRFSIGETGSLVLAILIVSAFLIYMLMVFGILIPKRIAVGNSERMVLSLSNGLHFFVKLVSPIVGAVLKSANLCLRLIGISPLAEPTVTEEDVKVLMDQGAKVGVFEEFEQDLIESVFRLANRHVEAVMTPRTEIFYLDLEESYEDNLKVVLESRHTRFPVCQGGLDNVQGIILAKDFLSRSLEGNAVDLNDLLLPPLFVPENMQALKAVESIKEVGVHVALVLDEHGGLLGMVTLFDLLEAMIGDIQINGEESKPMIVYRADGSMLCDGLMHVDEFKDIINHELLPEEDKIGFQTLGGFIMSQMGSIPEAGQWFDSMNYRFEIMDMDGLRVDKVLVSPLAAVDFGAGVLEI